MIIRSLSNLNKIINHTASAMHAPSYQSTMATIAMNGMNVGYSAVENKQHLRGMSAPIKCGCSQCGSLENPIDEFCKLK